MKDASAAAGGINPPGPGPAKERLSHDKGQECARRGFEGVEGDEDRQQHRLHAVRGKAELQVQDDEAGGDHDQDARDRAGEGRRQQAQGKGASRSAERHAVTETKVAAAMKSASGPNGPLARNAR